MRAGVALVAVALATRAATSLQPARASFRASAARGGGLGGLGGAAGGAAGRAKGANVDARPSASRQRWLRRLSRRWRSAPWRARCLRKVLFFASIVNVVPCVLRNDYAAAPWPIFSLPERKAPIVYRSLFYFAKLRPRVLFTLGAGLRALQLTTPVQHVFDPSVGCGAGLNLLALFVGSRWPAPIVLGWAASKRTWLLLGAETRDKTRVPITVKLQD